MADSSEQDRKRAKDEVQAEASVPPSPVEWTVRIASVVLVFALLSFVLYNAVTSDATSGFETEVLVDEVEQADSGWIVPILITNQGAEGITEVDFTVEQPGQSSEALHVRIPLIGQGEQRRIHVHLAEDPATSPPSVTIRSFQ